MERSSIIDPTELTHRTDRATRIELLLAGGVFALAIVTLLTQLQSLYTVPQYDGARWWGDEFGQILELKTELEEGAARIPTGVGATVEETNGIVRGNSWLAALIYGIPALLFFPEYDLVTIGRTVTAVLSLVLVGFCFYLTRVFGVSLLPAALTLLILIANRSFLFASHAARLDVAAGLAVLVWCGALVWLHKQERHQSLGHAWFVLFGAVTFGLCTLSIHLLTLLGPAAVYVLWRFQAFRRWTFVASALAGVLCVAGLLWIGYLASGAPITLFGVSSSRLQFHDVIDAMPGLRPFSWSVQSANLLQRVSGFAQEAPLFLLILPAPFVLLFLRRAGHERTLLALACIVIASWLLFESSARYYYIHVMPIALFATVAGTKELWRSRWGAGGLSLAVLVVSLFSIRDSLTAATSGEVLRANNLKALQSIERRLPDSGRVLSQYPAVALLHQNAPDRIVTTHLFNLPRDERPRLQVLRDAGIRHLVLYRTSRAQSYSFEVDSLANLASSGVVDTTMTGRFFDVGIDYFSPLFGQDTILLVRL